MYNRAVLTSDNRPVRLFFIGALYAVLLGTARDVSAGYSVVSSAADLLELQYVAAESGGSHAVFAVPPAGTYRIERTDAGSGGWAGRSAGIYRGYSLVSLSVDSAVVRAAFRISFTGGGVATGQTGVPSLEGIALNADIAAGWCRQDAVVLRRPAASRPFKVVLYTNADGIYRVYGRDLEQAGASLADLNANLASMQLLNHGIEIPVLVSGEGDGVFDTDDYFEFFGRRNRHRGSASDRYYDADSYLNPYLLAWGGIGSGARMVEENGAVVQTDRDSIKYSNRYRYTMHLEEDRLFNRLGDPSGTGVRDHWFWNLVYANTKEKILFDLPEPANGYELEMDLTVMLSGNYAEAGENHVVSIWFNDKRAGTDAVWAGQRAYRIDAAFDDLIFGETINEQANALEIAYEAPQTDASPSVMLNWVEATYWRKYRASGDYIEFSKRHDMSDGLFEFSVDGFSASDIRIYKMDKSIITYAQVERASGADAEGYRVVFQDNILDDSTRYVALTSARIRTPARIRAFDASLTSGGAEYVVIADPALEKEANDLATYRSARFSTAVVSMTALYDGYADGGMTPAAIRDFLADAYRTWSPAPRHVVLFGDGSWDNRSASAVSDVNVPVYLEYTEQWGVTASDNWYVCVDGDDPLPDMNIGRLPAANRFEASWMVDKIKAYESGSASGSWRRDLLCIAGVGDPYKVYEPEDVYRNQVEDIIRRYIPAEYDVSRVYAYQDAGLPYDPYFGTSADLVNELNEGCAVATFVGHGGGMVWSDKGLFTFNDIYDLDNADRLPLVISATCFTGSFDDPDQPGLGEAMLARRGDGAVAFWGASGLGYMDEDIPYVAAVNDQLYERNIRVLGDALSAAKAAYYTGRPFSLQDSTGAAWSLVVQFNLLGDPALQLALPGRSLSVCPETYTVRQGDSVACTVVLPAGTGGQVVWTLERYDTVLTEGTGAAAGDTCVFSVPVPAELADGPADIAVWHADANVVGRAVLSVGKTYGSRLSHTPETVTSADSVIVSAVLFGLDSLSDVTCRWYRKSDVAAVYAVPMALSGAGAYVAMASIPPDSCDSTTYYRVTYLDGGVPDSLTGGEYQVAIRPDLNVGSVSFAGIGYITAAAAITNKNNRSGEERTKAPVMTARNVCVRFAVNGMLLDSTVMDSLAYDHAETVAFQYTAPVFGDTVTITALLDGVPEDRGHVSDNTGYGFFEQSLYNVPAGSMVTVVSLDSLFFCRIPATGVDSSTVLSLAGYDLPMDDQPGFSYVTVPGADAARAFRIRLAAGAFADSVEIGFNLDRPAVRPENPGIFRWDDIAANWIRIAPCVDGSDQVRVMVLRTGYYALIEYSDATPPEIDINAEGQRFAEGSYVSGEPVLVAILQDDNGINTDTGMIELFLDGTAVARDAFSYIRSTSANTVPVTYPVGRISSGMHTVLLRATDCAGNTASVSRTFSRADELRIEKPGTYPSPFSDRTEFIFISSDNADIEIKIFSASGRLIRTLDDGYNPYTLSQDLYRITWDGTDDNGRDVANGVYHYRITATADNTKKAVFKGRVARYR